MLSIPMTRRQSRLLAGLLGLMLASALTEGIGVVLLVPILALLVPGGGAPNRIVDLIERLGLPIGLPLLLAVFVALILLRGIVNYMRTIAAFRFRSSIVDGLRTRAWRALLHCNWRRLSAMRQSDNASLLITSIDRIGIGYDMGLNALSVAVTLGGLGVAALAISPLVAISAAVLGALVLIAYRGLRRRATVLGEELDAAYANFHGGLNEGLSALRVIKSFGREDREEERGNAAIAALRRAQLAYMRDSAFAQIALQAGGAALLAGLVWLAIARWHVGAEQILPLVALFARALPLVEALQGGWQHWAHASPSARSALDLIAQAEAGAEPLVTGSAAAPALCRDITLSGVTVRFAGRDGAALSHVDLALPAGSVTVLAGPSGAGKSTLADLLGGMIGPDEGSVSVDGMVLEEGLRRAWRERVTYVQQEPLLFAGTLRDNFLWADPGADDARIAACLRAASAGFVNDLPDGLDTLVGESGRQLSGGERQRVVLARALLREPRLLILDEAASALDHENEGAIAAAVSRLRATMTIVIVGHRGALCELADRTVRIEGGRIVEAVA